jgi:prepilin-type N-terminal cleavage/methylation domain-containing protein
MQIITKQNKYKSGFTIVELLVVIVVIGILAAITVVSYTGISQKAIIASLRSDLSTASTRLKMYQTEYGTYPALDINNCPTSPTPIDTNYCLKLSSNNIKDSYTNTVSTFSLVVKNGTNSWIVTDNSAPSVFSPWIAGIGVMAGKFVYNADLSGTYMYKVDKTAVTAPQGATGLDPDYSSYMTLVNPQTNPAVDFSAYPAQNACKAVGGRLPNMHELSAIYADQSSYGTFIANYYWSSTESSVNYAFVMDFSYEATNTSKIGLNKVRCVLGL